MPNASLPAERLVDLVRGCALNSIHDFRQGINCHRFVVDQWSEDQMDMIGHDDSDFEIELHAVVVQT